MEVDAANRRALAHAVACRPRLVGVKPAREVACRPRLVGVKPAREVVPGMRPELILHPAPPAERNSLASTLEAALRALPAVSTTASSRRPASRR